MTEPTANGHANGTSNGSGHATHNSAATGDPNRRAATHFDRLERLVENAQEFRSQFFARFFGRADDTERINRDCGYPSTGALNDPWYFRALYEREPVATRVVQLMPKESWQITPLVYEDEDPENETDFERAWDDIGQMLRGEACWYTGEDGSPVWEHLNRADQLSGIGYFGVILLGIDDGRNLDQPADGVMTLKPSRDPKKPTTNLMWPSKPRATPNPCETASEVTVNRNGEPFAKGDVTEASPLMVPVHNSRGTVDFVTLEHAQRAIVTNRLVVNAVGGVPVKQGTWERPPQGAKGFGNGPNQGRHDPDSSRAQTSSGTEPFSPMGGEAFTSFAGAQGTDAQYVGVELSPPEYPSDEPSGQRRRLLFMRCYDEALVQIVQYEADVRNPRFGLPVMYRITLNDPSTQHSGVGLPLATVRVHWSRVIHLADNLDSSEIFGVPRMRPALNRILDVRKILGAGAEGYWKSASTGIALSTHPQLGGDVSIDEERTKGQLDDYFHDLNRGLVLMGMTASTIAPSVVDPTPHVAIHLESICIQLGCPVRVFKGSERGELASSQDDSSWNDRVKHRQRNYLTPRVIIPFIDRMIALGVLPVPNSTPEPEEEPSDPVADARAGDGQDDNQNSSETPEPLHPFLASRSTQGDQDVGDESNDGDSQAAKRDTGGPVVGQGRAQFGGSNPPQRGQPTGNTLFGPKNPNYDRSQSRGQWREKWVGKRYVVINAFGKPQVKAPEDVEPDDKVIGERPAEKVADVLDVPQGYSIEWPDIDSTTHKDKAGIALQEMQALAAYVGPQGNIESIINPTDMMADIMQWPEERVKQIVEDAKAHQDSTMTMPPAGDPGHPASGEPPPPPPNPLMVPHGSKIGPGVNPPGGIITGPKPPPAAANPLMVPHGSTLDGVVAPGGVVTGPKPPPGQFAQHPGGPPGAAAPMPTQPAVPAGPLAPGTPNPAGAGNPPTAGQPAQAKAPGVTPPQLVPHQIPPNPNKGAVLPTQNSLVENDEGWVTLKDGQHVYINGDGSMSPEGPKSKSEKTNKPPASKDAYEAVGQEASYDSAGSGKVDVSKSVNKSIKILDSLDPAIRKEILSYRGAYHAKDAELKMVSLKDIKPTQHGADRINSSSENSAETLKSGNLSDIAKADLSPIVLDKDGNIQDGNHRFSAAEMNGQTHVYAWVPKKTQNRNKTEVLPTQNWSPDQPRGADGKFAGAEVEAVSLTKKVWASGGFTYKPLGSKSPKSGFIVSLDRSEGWEKPIPDKMFKEKGKALVLDYLKKARDAVKAGELDPKVAHVGAWHDASTGRVVLDVNEVYDSKKEALDAGRKRKQDAIFDLGTHTEIDLRSTRNAREADRGRDGRGAGRVGRANPRDDDQVADAASERGRCRGEAERHAESPADAERES